MTTKAAILRQLRRADKKFLPGIRQEGDLVQLVAKKKLDDEHRLATYLKNNFGSLYSSATDQDWLSEARDILRLLGAAFQVGAKVTELNGKRGTVTGLGIGIGYRVEGHGCNETLYQADELEKR